MKWQNVTGVKTRKGEIVGLKIERKPRLKYLALTHGELLDLWDVVSEIIEQYQDDTDILPDQKRQLARLKKLEQKVSKKYHAKWGKRR